MPQAPTRSPKAAARLGRDAAVAAIWAWSWC